MGVAGLAKGSILEVVGKGQVQEKTWVLEKAVVVQTGRGAKWNNKQKPGGSEQRRWSGFGLGQKIG